MESKEQMWEEVKPAVKMLAEAVMEKLVIKAIDQVIADSENKYDDAFWAMAKPAIVAEIKNQISHI